MAIDITMPALSPTMESGTLARWLVKVGDVVRPGDLIAEIETDKATMEVEAVDEGRVMEILVAEGTEDVKVNAVIARLEGEGDPAAKPAAVPPPAEAAVAPGPAPAPAPSETPRMAPAPPAGGRIIASPLARKMAAGLGVDLATLSGSGPGGRIVRADVEAAAGRVPQPGVLPAPP
ncbi:biotin/lipoyl-containing protein, partial [Thermaurantiacus sp.]